MGQLQRRLFLATTSSDAITSSVFSTAPSVSSSRLGSFMAKLQSRTLKVYTSKCIPALPFTPACNYARCSQFVFRKDGATFSIKTKRAKAGQYHACDGPNYVFTLYSRLTVGFPHAFALSNASNRQFLNGSFTPKLPNYGAFGKKFFSHSTEAGNETDDKNANYGRNGMSTLPFEGLNNKWKSAKPVATSRIKKTSASGSSGSTSVDGTNSSEQLVGSMKEADLISSNSSTSAKKASKGLKEKRSGSKKKKEAISSTNAADVQAVCKDGQSKSLDSCDNDLNLVQDSKKKLTGGTSEGSASTKHQSNKKKGTSSRKRETKKNDNKMSLKQNLVADAKWKSHGQTTLKQFYPPMGKTVMMVESVTKAKVIQNYLGDMFEVLPSHGHVRDLAARSGSVRPDDDFSMVWEVPSPAWTHLKSIKVSLNGAENLILASDPDIEGEAIAWQIIEMLQQQDALHERISIARVVFHEITEASIKSALQSPRGIDANLVQAYLAPRALDYLIGFYISPLLWRKLPGCQSAGRVQSAALALICDREMEIEKYRNRNKQSLKSSESFGPPGYIAKTLYGEDEDNNSIEEPRFLGLHPVSSEKILLKSGPYGFYVQLGEDRKGYLPKRASVSQIKDVDSITLEDALELLRYPITLGHHPKDGQPVIVKIAKAGFAVRHRHTMASLPKGFLGCHYALSSVL